MSVIDCLFLTVVNAAICIMLPRGLSLIGGFKNNRTAV